MSHNTMTTLETDGVVVFKVLSLEELVVHRAALLAAAMAAPELKAAATVDTLPVLGAFGAHGYPSSQHNLAVRELRKVVHAAAVSAVFQDIAKDQNLEQLIDR